MALPGVASSAFRLIVPKTLKSGIEVYKRGHRRVSKAAWRAQQWRLAGGKAGTLRKAALAENFGDWMRAEVGPPGGSMTWKQLYTKYPEKLEDYIGEWNAQR